MWAVLARMFVWVFRHDGRDSTRKDFSLITQEWEELAQTFKSELKETRGRVVKLRKQMRFVVRELRKCREERRADHAQLDTNKETINELRRRIAQLERSQKFRE